MLTIRKEQMKVMVDFSNKAFESRLLQQIKTHYPALIATLMSVRRFSFACSHNRNASRNCHIDTPFVAITLLEMKTR